MTYVSGKKALFEWYHVCATSLEQLPYELTMRQWSILLHVYLIDSVHTVRSLAYSFDIPKPSVCRALDSLSMMELLKRRRDENDARSIIVLKTMKGIAFLNHFSDIVESHITFRKENSSIKVV